MADRFSPPEEAGDQPENKPTKALLVIIQSKDAEVAMEELKLLNLPCLLPIASSGGFLREGNTALWIGALPGQLPRIMDVLGRTCHRRAAHVPTYYIEASYVISAFPIEVEIGGATVFICDVEQFEVF
jgi:uncharacterized protein YaaQ